MPNSIQKALAGVPRSPSPISRDDLDLSPNVPGEETVIGELKAERPLFIREDATFDLDIPAYESFSMPGDGSQETLSLSNDLVDAEHMPVDATAYQDGGKLSIDSVDYAADEITVTDNNTGGDLHLWYMAGDQALVKIQKISPKNIPETIEEDDLGLMAVRDQLDNPLSMNFGHTYQGVTPTDWRLQIRVSADYQISFSEDNGDAKPDLARIKLPAYRARDRINGLGQFIGQIAGQQ